MVQCTVHDEWIESVLERRSDLRREQLDRTRELMNSSVRDCIVEGFEPLIESLKLLATIGAMRLLFSA